MRIYVTMKAMIEVIVLCRMVDLSKDRKDSTCSDLIYM